MATHTPGPWAVIREDHDISVDGEGWFEDQHVNGWVVVGNAERPDFACAVIDTGYRNSWNDSLLDSNVALIAAAPDLLASLIELLAPLEAASAAMVAEGKALNDAGEAAFDRARSAIAKAQGGAA